MKRTILLFACVLMGISAINAQKTMSPPTVMIVPDDIYCKSNGYTLSFNNQGSIETRPDYEKALTEDQTLHAVLLQIGQLITDRNSSIEIIDILTAINNYKADISMNESNFGSEAESVDEAIIRNSQADILIKINFTLLKNGPQRQVQWTMAGIDAYTSMQFAPISGVGQPATAASPAILVREAVFGQMDAFLQKMLGYYQRMSTNGRGISFNFKIIDGSALSMNSKIGDYTLQEVIDDFLYDNSVDGNGLEKVRGGNTFLNYQCVYVPLMAEVRGRLRKQNANQIANKLRAYLEENYNIQSEFKTIGLGKVNFYIK